MILLNQLSSPESVPSSPEVDAWLWGLAGMLYVQGTTINF